MKTKIKGAGRNKPDLQLTYWNNWAIFDPCKDECLVSFTPTFLKGYSGNIDKICEDIKNYPGPALRSPIIWDQIAFIRESELKDDLPSGSFNRILKAMKIDRRHFLIKDEDGDLCDYDPQKIIPQNLKFFLEIQNRGENGRNTVAAAIDAYKKKTDLGAPDYEEPHNYKRIYNAYKKAYDKLTEKLTYIEAIHFLETAGREINQSSYFQTCLPDKRDLIYAKGEYITKYQLGRID